MVRDGGTATGGTMRRIVSCALILLFALAVVAPSASATTAGRRVAGALTGAGGFRFSCGVITQIGNGTFHANALGSGTYAFNVCVTIDGSTITFDGTITLTTAGGATLTGTIGGTFTGGPGPTFDVAVTGGTKQFAHAGGALTVGPLVESDFTNCVPRFCFDWRDTGPITGTITHVP